MVAQSSWVDRRKSDDSAATPVGNETKRNGTEHGADEGIENSSSWLTGNEGTRSFWSLSYLAETVNLSLLLSSVAGCPCLCYFCW